MLIDGFQNRIVLVEHIFGEGRVLLKVFMFKP
jgi:hypothetical protein